MVKWQYRSVRLMSPSTAEMDARRKAQTEQGWTDLQTHTALAESSIAWMNELGGQGWEAVGLVVEHPESRTQHGVYTILFKRPVEE